MSPRQDRLQLTRTQRQRFRRLRQLRQLQALDPLEFELFCGYLYRRSGYRVYTTVASGDQGVDLFLRRGVQRVVVQCKRYRGTVGQPTVRDLYGTMQHNGANAAVLVTTGRFSRAAEQWAADKPIQLVDGHDLVSWTRRLGRPRAGRIPQANYWQSLALRVALVALLLVAGAALLWSWQRGSAASPAPTATPPPTAFAAPRLSAAVDGRLGEWGAAARLPLETVVDRGPGWSGSSDLAAAWQSAWDDAALQGAVAVEDDRYLSGEDTLTLYIALPAANGDLVAHILTFDPGALGGNGGIIRDSAGAPVAAARLASARSNSGYALEYAVPWTALAADGPVPFLRLALTVRDVDDPTIGLVVALGSATDPVAGGAQAWPWVALVAALEQEPAPP